MPSSSKMLAISAVVDPSGMVTSTVSSELPIPPVKIINDRDKPTTTISAAATTKNHLAIFEAVDSALRSRSFCFL